MRVIVPQANEHRDPVGLEAVRRNLRHQDISFDEYAIWGDVYEYSRLFNWLWDAEPDGFIVVEHDVLPWQGFYRTLVECPSPWAGLNTSLQATKFVPSSLGSCPVGEVHWQEVDKLFYELWNRGHNFCEHPPEPAHITFPYPDES